MSFKIIPVNLDTLLDDAVCIDNGEFVTKKNRIRFDITSHISCIIKLLKFSAVVSGFGRCEARIEFKHSANNDCTDVAGMLAVESIVYGPTMEKIRAVVSLPIAAIFPVYADYMTVEKEMSCSEDTVLIYTSMPKELRELKIRLDRLARMLGHAGGQQSNNGLKVPSVFENRVVLSMFNKPCMQCLHDIYALGNKSCAAFLEQVSQ